MIFVKRDLSKVDPNVMAAAVAASAALDAIIDPTDRRTFIDSNQAVWTAFRSALLQMSHRKCWYSESFEAVSRYDVDHFRPKGKARISREETSEGYSWLAFDPSNFVLAGQLCNQANREYSDITVGKANWFPLYDPSKAATLANRDYSEEAPILLDPTDKQAPALLEFNEDGTVQPNSSLAPDYQSQINWAIELLGIRQTQLNDARRQHRTTCRVLVRIYKGIFRKPPHARTDEERENLKNIAEELLALGSAKSQFSAMTRALLLAEGLPQFVIHDEYD
ncbi:hypothetical protein [Mesorhizobium sp. GbtcB19]|uniref:hypothetical protein n=1 Tax=Mesorhizobium sp. GbtcB19 TaxID=2824764 RepID=UPI001C2FC780|nr:hypothetical protein [Mesorhizobium sp. GbtcB19]